MNGNVEIVKNAPRKKIGDRAIRAGHFAAVDGCISRDILQEIGADGYGVYVQMLQVAGSSFRCTSKSLAALFYKKVTESKEKQIKRIITKLQRVGLVERLLDEYKYCEEKGVSVPQYRYKVYEVPKEQEVVNVLDTVEEQPAAAVSVSVPEEQEVNKPLQVDSWYMGEFDKSDFTAEEIEQNIISQPLYQVADTKHEIQRITDKIMTIDKLPEIHRSTLEKRIKTIIEIGERYGLQTSEQYDVLVNVSRLAPRKIGQKASNYDIGVFAKRIRQAAAKNEAPSFEDIFQQMSNILGR